MRLGAAITFDADRGDAFDVRPREWPRPGLRMHPFRAMRLGIALAPATQLPTFFAESADAMLDHRHDRGMMSARVRLVDLTYQTDASMQRLAARSAEVSVRAEDAVLRGQTPADTSFLMVADANVCTARCELHWGEISFVHEHGISARLNMRRPVCVCDGPEDDATVGRFLRDFPWHPADLDLDHAELEFMRPDDGLWLRFRFRDMALTRGFTGFRLRSRTPSALMSLVLPPQAIAEQAFFRAPAADGLQPVMVACAAHADPYGIPLVSNPNEARKQLHGPAVPGDVTDRAPSCDVYSDRQPPDDGLARGRVSGESVFCFSPVEKCTSLGVRLEELLDASRWKLIVADSAADSLQGWRDRLQGAADHSYPPDITDANQLEWTTHIEMPWRLHISPTDGCGIDHAPLHLKRAERFHRLFHVSAQRARGALTPFRAIFSPDHHELEPKLPPHQTFGNDGDKSERRSLDGRDRDELVWLTARWGRAALRGSKNVVNVTLPGSCGRSAGDFGLYDPQPFLVEQLRLTAFGGGMRSKGEWDPPSLRPVPIGRGSTCNEFALSVEQWQHRSSLGRTHWEQVNYRGWLMPFGFRATLIKITSRELAAEKWDGRWVAILVQRYFIQVDDPILSPPLAGQPAISMNQMCHPETFQLNLPVPLEIDDPNDTSLKFASFNLNGRGQSAFVVRVAGRAHPFAITVGGQGKGTCPLAFLDNTVTHDPVALDDVQPSVLTAYNGLDAVFRTFNHDGGPVCYAPPTKAGDTSFGTTRMVFGMVVNKPLINSTLLETAQQPPLYPVVQLASVLVRAIQTQTGQTVSAQDPSAYRDVQYNRAYVATSFDARTNAAEAFLDLLSPQSLAFRGRTQRSGGVANTDTTAVSLSRSKGLLSFAPTAPVPAPSALGSPLAAKGMAAGGGNSTQVESHAGFDLSARLLGTVRLVDVLGALGLDDLPKLLERAEQALDKAGAELDAWVVTVAKPVQNAFVAIEAQWQSIDVGGWLGTKVYRQVQDPLAKVVEALDALISDQPETQRLVAAAAVVPTMTALAAAISTLVGQPDAVIKELLSAELAPLLGILADVQKGVGDIKDDIGGLKKSAGATGTRIRQDIDACRDAVAATLSQVSPDVSSRAQALANDLAQQLGRLADAELGHVDDLVVALDSAVAEYVALYGLVQCVVDDAETYRSNKVAQWTTFIGALDALSVDLGRQRITNDVLLAAKKWQVTLSDAFTRVPDAEGADAFAAAVRRVDTHVKRVQSLLKALRDQAMPELNPVAAPSATQAPVDDEACFRVGRVLLEEAFAAAAELEGLDPTAEIAVLTRNAATEVENQLGAALQKLQSRWQAVTIAAHQLLSVSTGLPADSLMTLLQRLDALAPGAKTPAVGSVQDQLELACALFDVPKAVRLPAAGDTPQPWNFYADMIGAAVGLVRSVFVLLLPLLGKLAQLPAALPADSPLVDSLLGSDFRAALQALAKSINAVGTTAPQSPAGCVRLCRTIQEQGLTRQLSALVLQIERLGSIDHLVAQVLAAIQAQVETLLGDFVPTRIRTSYAFNKQFNCETGSVFMTGVGSAVCGATGSGGFSDPNDSLFTINSTVDMDLLYGDADFHIDGSLSSFRLSILGFITLPVSQASFHSSAKAGFKLDAPQFCAPDLQGGPLAFLTEIMELAGLGDGLFVLPGITGIRAGYRFQIPLIQAGGMAIQNFGFEAAIEIPFDDRAAEISIALASAEAPVLLSIGIYGGGAYFDLTFCGDRLVAIDAMFVAGLVGAFDVAGVLHGDGRVTVGILYRQAGDKATLGGIFYCGGHATVLSIVSIAADLSVTIVQAGDGATGTGNFSVRVGVGIFSWSLSYTVTHSQSNGAGAARAMAVPRQLNTASRCARPPGAGGHSDIHPADELVDHWADYRAAFAEVPA
jgi:hypothetical protein